MSLDHISSTQVSMFCRCQAAWMFRYVWGKSVPPKSAMMRGTCVHKAVARDYAQKVVSKVNLPVADVLDAFSDEYETRSDAVAWKESEDKGKIKDGGIAVLAKYHEVVAVNVQPVDVEQSFSMNVAWVQDDEDHSISYRGILDVADDAGGITDLKSTSKTPKRVSGDHSGQIVGYFTGKEAMGDEPKSAHLDYLVVLKEPKIVQFTVEVTDSQKKFFLTQIPKIVMAMEAGNYYAARGSMYCSPDGCGFWKMCIEEFGG